MNSSRAANAFALIMVALLTILGDPAIVNIDLAPTLIAPTLADFWDGRAKWVLDRATTGLPLGESDTIRMDNGEYWSYLHASHQSAGILDHSGASNQSGLIKNVGNIINQQTNWLVARLPNKNLSLNL